MYGWYRYQNFLEHAELRLRYGFKCLSYPYPNLCPTSLVILIPSKNIEPRYKTANKIIVKKVYKLMYFRL